MGVIILKSEELSVTISTLGAEVVSVKDKFGKEYIWEGDPNFWDGHAPVLFPIVGVVEDGKYSFDGKEYEMGMHGFAKFLQFEVEKKTDDNATFLLKSSPETKKMYPFDFEFRVIYHLSGRNLTVDFETTNKTNGKMYYSTGAHEAYKIDGDVSNYSIVLQNDETLSRYEVLPSRKVSEKPIPCFKNSRELKLSEEYFKIDAIIFFDMKSKSVALRDDRTGHEIKVDFEGFDTLLVWKKPNAKYVCIEPWAGTLDLPWHKVDDFSKKYRIRTLQEGESETLTHKVRF